MTSQDSESLTAVDYLSSQLSLEREARELMPWDPKRCTYVMGPTRQQLYACLDCHAKTDELAGICYSCSIRCHSEHNLVELYTKRSFTCDCGTKRTDFPCSLRHKATDDIPSSSNVYNDNFRGKFCHCARDYNPTEETGNMLQCILGDVCGEDWFHDYCIMGLPKFDPPKRENEGVNLLDTLGEPGLDAETTMEEVKVKDEGNDQIKKEEQDEEGDEDDEKEVAIDGFPNLNDFDGFICWKCINKHKNFFDKVKENSTIVADILQRVEAPTIEARNTKIKEQQGGFNALKKRKVEQEYSLFLLPDHEKHFTDLFDKSTDDAVVINFLKEFSFLMKDDRIYEPPPDEDDDNSSIYDLGAKAINSLPREQAISGVRAYEDIKSKLKNFLKPFADDKKVVNKEDIETFFKALKEDKR